MTSQSSTPTTGEGKIVMFADMLGFAALTEQQPLEPRKLGGNDRLDTIFAGIVEGRNPLTHAFNTFHRSLRWALQIAQMSHPLTAISFSDSAFIATAKLHQAISLASYLMRSVLGSDVPMRIGIAAGTFEAVQFRSDISMVGGDHAAQFLGTGVVRAERTETCGIKGCRVLLHPSAAALLADPTHNPASGPEKIRVQDCAAEELANKVHVTHEVNYWPSKRTDDECYWRSLQGMWDAAPASEHVHYAATAAAVNRMRMALGHPPITDLRRRTVPRKASRNS